MKRPILGLLAVLLSVFMLALGACDDEPAAEPTDDAAADAADVGEDPAVPDVVAEVVDDQGPPDVVAPDVPPPDVPPPDTPPPDLPPEDLGPGECTVDTTGVDYPANYLNDTGGNRPVRLVIEWVDFINNRVGIRNVGTGTIDFNEEWRVGISASSGPDWTLAAARDLAPGAQMRIRMTEGGINTTGDTFLNLNTGDLYACGGEFVILHNPTPDESWNNHPAYIEGFVMWGTREPLSAAATWNNEAVDADAYALPYDNVAAKIQTCYVDGGSEYNSSYCDPVPPCGADNSQGIIATGDVTDPEDWLTVDASEAGCFR